MLNSAKLLRSAIEKIELVTVAGKEVLSANLPGRLAGISSNSTKSAGKPPKGDPPAEWRAMVARHATIFVYS